MGWCSGSPSLESRGALLLVVLFRAGPPRPGGGIRDASGGVVVPLSLYLALILEASALLKRARPVLAVSCGALILLIVTWRQWEGMGASSVVVGMAVAVVLLVIGLFFVMGFLLSYQCLAHAHTQLEAAHVHLHSSAAQIETLTLLTERQRIAREMHDTLARGLAGIILQLGWRTPVWLSTSRRSLR